MASNAETSGPRDKMRWWRPVLGAAGALAVIAACEPFYPTRSISGNPGLFYWLTILLITYRLGMVAGLLGSLLLCGYMAAGPLLPGSAFESTRNNELRVAASGVIFVASAVVVGLVRRAISRANEKAELEVARRKEAEGVLRSHERLTRRIVEASHDAIVTLDPQGRILLWNRHAETLFGWSSGEVIGQPVKEILDFESPIARDIWDFKQELSRVEGKACHRSGQNLDVELSVVRSEDSGDQVLIAFIRDISDRKKAQAELQSLNASLEQRVRERTAELVDKNEELEGFTYAISHDIRSPLRSIVVNARMVLEDEGQRVSHSGRTSLEKLAAAALRMSLLVDDLLRYARVGNQAVDLQTVNVSELAHAARAQVLIDYPTAEIEVDPDISATADEMLLLLVLGNLLDNACKYVKPGSSAKVRVTGSELTDGCISVRISDQGIGIAEKDIHQLFRPLGRLHPESVYPGTGFGLANVRRSVERMGGTVEIESEPGQGTDFILNLRAATG